MAEPATALRIRPAVTRFIQEEARRSRDGRETGGVLVGYDEDGLVEVTWAGGPGPSAIRRRGSLDRDTAHAQEIVNARWVVDGSDWVGEWHTHMSGLPVPSTQDLGTYDSLVADSDLAFGHFVALIVTALDREWNALVATGWIVDQDGLHTASLVM